MGLSRGMAVACMFAAALGLGEWDPADVSSPLDSAMLRCTCHFHTAALCEPLRSECSPPLLARVAWPAMPLSLARAQD